MKKPIILLYHPASGAYNYPLSLLAIASLMDRSSYEIQIVDAGIEAAPLTVVEAYLDNLLCLGVTVVTGRPIADALRVSQFAKERRPELPIIWGGWHPSIFPDQCLASPYVDIVVAGQGEETFAEVVQRLTEGRDLDGCQGAIFKKAGQVVHNAPRPLVDVNRFPPLDFSLLNVARYMEKRGAPVLDFCSSQGCPWRCTFCSEPLINRRRWTGLDGTRLVAELAALARRYGFQDVHFMDELFFVNRKRVRSFAETLVAADPKLRWRATARADEIARADDEFLALIRRSGGYHIFVGAESGSQTILDRIKKDISVEHIWAAAQKLHRFGFQATFTFIVGFPHESPATANETIDMAKRLRDLDPGFDTPLLFFTPYPGTEEYLALAQQNIPLPITLEEWAGREFKTTAGAWVSPRLKHTVQSLNFYLPLAYPARPDRTHPLKTMVWRAARWRVEHDFYAWPLERPLQRWYRQLRPTRGRA
ncbi:MAG: radical SAM protein [Anaerolineae bacterium]|jgi:anaerobic magnesium-protoporphyrin IX monomethyl ester cyclase